LQTFYKYLTTISVLLIALLSLVLAQKVNPAQSIPNIAAYQFPDSLNSEVINVDSLWQIVGDHKTVPLGFEKAALIAYSAYPELRDIQIEMILTNSGAPMETNFKFQTLFGPKSNRVYQILLNDSDQSLFEPILLKNLPFNAQVGILAHELGHVVYYKDLSTFQIAKWGIMYLISSEFRATHERSTDLMPIYHGLGEQIYDYAYYIRHDTSCQPLYQQFQDFADTYYMTDIELRKTIKNY